MKNRSGQATDVQHCTTRSSTIPHRAVVAPGDLRVGIAAPQGLKTQPLKHARTGATVQATAYIQSITLSTGGRIRGVVRNNTGTAIFTVGRDVLPGISALFQPQASVRMRGTVARVGRFATIDVTDAQAVTSW